MVEQSAGNKANAKKTYKILGCRFELPEAFEVIDPLGSGAYGTVVAAKDENGNFVAIKKMEKVFEHRIYAQRTLRELKIMRLLEHENILSCKTIMQPESIDKFGDLYVVMDLMESDLSTIIKSK